MDLRLGVGWHCWAIKLAPIIRTYNLKMWLAKKKQKLSHFYRRVQSSNWIRLQINAIFFSRCSRSSFCISHSCILSFFVPFAFSHICRRINSLFHFWFQYSWYLWTVYYLPLRRMYIIIECTVSNCSFRFVSFGFFFIFIFRCVNAATKRKLTNEQRQGHYNAITQSFLSHSIT